jgi:hypothetical protein
VLDRKTKSTLTRVPATVCGGVWSVKLRIGHNRIRPTDLTYSTRVANREGLSTIQNTRKEQKVC